MSLSIPHSFKVQWKFRTYFCCICCQLEITRRNKTSLAEAMPGFLWQNGLPHGALWSTGYVQGDGDRDGTLSPQGRHRPLCLSFITRSFDPSAAQVGQLVELHTVFLLSRGARWCWTGWWHLWRQTYFWLPLWLKRRVSVYSAYSVGVIILWWELLF